MSKTVITIPLPQSASPQRHHVRRDEDELRAARFAMRMSLLAVAVVMLLGKAVAYYVTWSPIWNRSNTTSMCTRSNTTPAVQTGD